MVPRAPRIALWLSAMLLPLLAPETQAGLFRRDIVIENVYQGSLATVVAPTSYVVPTSYFVPTSYVSPTSYVMPTSYVTTSSYVTPTSYVVPATYSMFTPAVYTSSSSAVPTSYVVPSSYVVPTTYYRSARYRPSSVTYAVTPTSYYLPTSASYPLVTTAATTTDLCSSSSVVTLPATSVSAVPAASSSNSNSRLKQSTPLRQEREPELNPRPAQPKSQPQPQPQPQPQSLQEQPVQPLLEHDSPAEMPPPAAPANDQELLSPPDIKIPADGAPDVNPSGLREVQRPAFKNQDLNLSRPKHDLTAALLRGRIISGKTSEPEAGVKVTFSNEGGRFRNRTFTSNGQGLFDVPALPDGDWTVEVEDTAGKAVPYATLTVSAGKVTDDRGVEWSTLTLNR